MCTVEREFSAKSPRLTLLSMVSTLWYGFVPLSVKSGSLTLAELSGWHGTLDINLLWRFEVSSYVKRLRDTIGVALQMGNTLVFYRQSWNLHDMKHLKWFCKNCVEWFYSLRLGNKNTVLVEVLLLTHSSVHSLNVSCIAINSAVSLMCPIFTLYLSPK